MVRNVSLHDDFVRCGIDSFFPQDVVLDAVQNGLKTGSFADVIIWLCEEICALYGIEESIEPPSSNNEEFLIELSSLLHELNCPIESLTTGPVAQRFVTAESRERLFTFLVGHLKCARLTALRSEYESARLKKTNEEAILLASITEELGGSRTVSASNPQKLFSWLSAKVRNQLSMVGDVPRPLLTASLKDKQWQRVEEINRHLLNEYHNRIQLLLKRLDVTIESFTWSDRLKVLEGKVHDIYRSLRDSIISTSQVSMSDLLAATTELLTVYKASGEKERARTASKLNKLMIAEKPSDRGGRPSELRAPPPEMPPWMSQRSFTPSGASGGGRGGRGSGDYRGGGDYTGGGDYRAGGDYRGGGGGYRGGGRGRGYGGGFQNQVMNEYEAANQRYQNVRRDGYGGYQSRGGGYDSYHGSRRGDGQYRRNDRY
ncbi:hypothetical protein AB6A40_008817 [Gnathostoma spinigerum]|uniref:Protein FAM98A n=1 Tax=Gnathostoma spinigerum TaxID=75299 RepID=A0ABD6EYF5_9BILA